MSGKSGRAGYKVNVATAAMSPPGVREHVRYVSRLRDSCAPSPCLFRPFADEGPGHCHRGCHTLSCLHDEHCLGELFARC